MNQRQRTAYQDPIAYSDGAPPLPKFRSVKQQGGMEWCTILTVNK